MSHYHEVYFNRGSQDGPRVGMTRRTKREILTLRKIQRHVWPGSAIVRCDRADGECPWTLDGVPGETADCATTEAE